MSQNLFLPRDRFDALFHALQKAGYACVGPQIRDGAIVYDSFTEADELVYGKKDQQAPGEYRLVETGQQRFFAWANGPECLKPLTFTPEEKLWRMHKEENDELSFERSETETPALAIIGVRACDLAALALQEQHFLRGKVPDYHFAARRENLLLVAVHCTHPAATCFCVSTGDGPTAEQGYDLALYEIDEGFIIDFGSERGRSILETMELSACSEAQLARAHQEVDAAARSQQRSIPAANLQKVLFDNLDHPRWSEVAERCLACGNCTSACPICFCSRETNETALKGEYSQHSRQWDSCFTSEHSYMTGFTIRTSTQQRYKQWLTHKFGSWREQYGRSGCTGCGRCITWCPAAIDVTEELNVICHPDGSDGLE